MKLKSFGCSFIFGTDLKDCDTKPPWSQGSKSTWPQGSKSTWPALLAQKLDAPYECHARPGSGNLQITERILNQLPASKDDVFVIGWSWIDRFDHYQEINPWQPWKTLLPGDSNKLSQTYYKYLQTEYSDKLNTLIKIKMVIDILTQHHVRFLMTYTDVLMFDQQFHTSPAVTHLQSSILPYMTTFEGQTFLDWSRQHGYAESSTWHPLEEAHRAAADYMITFFDKQKIAGPAQQARV
jgi:hypothetical protein